MILGDVVIVVAPPNPCMTRKPTDTRRGLARPFRAPCLSRSKSPRERAAAPKNRGDKLALTTRKLLGSAQRTTLHLARLVDDPIPGDDALLAGFLQQPIDSLHLDWTSKESDRVVNSL